MLPPSPLLDLLRGQPPAIDDPEAWRELIDLARVQGVLPILENAISSAAPPEVAEELERLHYERLAIAVLQERETIRLVRLLQHAGIDVLTFKGQVLSLEAYGQIGLRESGDIDLLVRHDDAARAAATLVTDGFTFYLDLTPREWERVLRSDSAWALRKGEIIVDLHWRLFSRTTAFDLSTADALAATRTIDLGGAEIPTLSHDHLALFLAIHGAKHFWERLEWLTSFAAIAKSPEIDWGHVRELARQHSGTKRLEEAEQLAVILSAAKDLVSNTRGESARSFAALKTTPVDRLLADARQFDRKRDAARAAAIALFQPKLPDWRWLRLPRWLEWLYPAVRVVRLFSPSPRQQTRLRKSK